MSSTLGELSKKRASTKGQVTLQIKYLAPLLELRGRDAVKRSNEVKDLHAKLVDKVSIFRSAHEQYTEQLVSETEEKELEKTLVTLQEYYNEVDIKFYDTSKKFDVFNTECEILELKDDLESLIAGDFVIAKGKRQN